MNGPIVIFAAMQVEARAIARALGLASTVKGTWQSAPGISRELHLHLVGLRAGRLKDEMLLGASCAIMAGVAGGLDPALNLGDVVIDDPAWIIKSPPPSAIPGRIHTAAQIVCSPAEKATLYRQTEAAVVDMEMDIVRPAALRLQIPLIGLRAVLDDAACALPTYLVQITDEIGQPRIFPFAGRMIRHPTMLAELTRLGKDAQIALNSLTQALLHLIRQLSQDA